MSASLTQEQQEIAKYALVAGVAKVSRSLSMPEADLARWVTLLPLEDLTLVQRVRELAVQISQRMAPAAAAKCIGLSERFASELQSYTGGLQSPPTDKSTQTSNCLDLRGCDLQTEGDEAVKEEEERRMSRLYSTAEKVSAVRVFMKYSNTKLAAKELKIPRLNLIRWRDKIRSQLFQEPHVASIYCPDKKARDKFFQDMDEALYSWYLKNKARYSAPDEALLHKARSVAKIEDAQPTVTEAWKEAFKKHYHII
jgi:hypothetical protein